MNFENGLPVKNLYCDTDSRALIQQYPQDFVADEDSDEFEPEDELEPEAVPEPENGLDGFEDDLEPADDLESAEGLECAEDLESADYCEFEESEADPGCAMTVLCYCRQDSSGNKN